MDDLITLEELKVALNIPESNEQQDDKLSQAIIFASQAIRSYTDRSFDVDSEEDVEKTYVYDGSGFLEIDDASEITEVKILDVVINPDLYLVQPYGKSPYSWIELPESRSSTEQLWPNWPVIARTFPRKVLVTVTGSFGWDEVPADVKQATVWCASSFAETARPFVTESIEGYSRTFPNPQVDAIPARAKQLLDRYIRVNM
jgi:hypothetical protein